MDVNCSIESFFAPWGQIWLMGSTLMARLSEAALLRPLKRIFWKFSLRYISGRNDGEIHAQLMGYLDLKRLGL